MIDGEGTFLAGVYKNTASKKFQLMVSFRLAQRADDVRVCKAFCEYFSCGSVHFRKEKSGNPCYSFNICTKETLSVLIKHLGKFPLHSKKSIEYPIWKELALEFIRGKKNWKFSLRELREKCKKLRKAKKFNKQEAKKAANYLGKHLFREDGKRTWRFHENKWPRYRLLNCEK